MGAGSSKRQDKRAPPWRRPMPEPPLRRSESLGRARTRCSQAHVLLPGVDGLQHHQRDGDMRRNPGAQARCQVLPRPAPTGASRRLGGLLQSTAVPSRVWSRKNATTQNKNSSPLHFMIGPAPCYPHPASKPGTKPEARRLQSSCWPTAELAAPPPRNAAPPARAGPGTPGAQGACVRLAQGARTARSRSGSRCRT